jgi:hypothetical protein
LKFILVLERTDAEKLNRKKIEKCAGSNLGNFPEAPEARQVSGRSSVRHGERRESQGENRFAGVAGRRGCENLNEEGEKMDGQNIRGKGE